MIRPLDPNFKRSAEATTTRPENGGALSLDALKRGHEGCISALVGPEILRRRLMEIGFVPGSAVRFEMATPFGDPLVFSLRGSTIALRRSEARCVRLSAG